jgi:energy-coupling factor transporter ATP-binding protein EcfA2
MIILVIWATTSVQSIPQANPLWVAASIALSSALYAVWRPAEWQLRHQMADDDKMIVPLHRSTIAKTIEWWLSLFGENVSENMRSGQPPGSQGAVELEKDRSVLVLGETGSGKSKAIEILAHQMESGDSEPVVAYDYKQDYQQFFEKVIRLSAVGSDRYWNVFKEIRDEDDCKEIAKAIFSTAENNYFTNSAAQVFEGVLIMLHRWGEADDYEPSNLDLLEYVNSADVDTLRQDFEEAELSMKKHMSEEAEASQNIVSNLEMQVSQVFCGDFAKEGDFSVREYMHDPQDHALIFDFPIDKSASAKPIFRLLIDWSIRFGMMDDRGAYFILDEFAGLPRLSMLERLVNAGRAYNCYAIFGVQAVSQLNSTYGRDDAESLLSGMAQEIHLRVGDESSVKYIRHRLGKAATIRGGDGYERRSEEHAMSSRTIQQLEAGRGIVHTTEGWQRGQLYMLEEVEGSILPKDRSTFQRIKAYRQRVENRITALDSGTEEDTAIEEADRERIEAADEEPADD